MTSKPRRQNGEVAMKRVITNDKLRMLKFLSSAMTGLTLMLSHASFTENMLDEAIDFMDDEGKAKLALVTYNFTQARVLLNSALLQLMPMGEEPDGGAEVNPDAE